MTVSQKQSILDLRNRGLSYTQVSAQTNLSVNTVKSFCRRTGMTEPATSRAAPASGNVCRQCGGELRYAHKTKPKTFCCPACRNAYWNARRARSDKKSLVTVLCAHCGKPFAAYPCAERKFCCHAHYIAYRFLTEGTADER